MADAIIIDTKTLILSYDIGGPAGWDIFVSDPTRKVIIPSTILDEVTFGTGPMGADFDALRTANSTRIIDLKVSMQVLRDYYSRSLHYRPDC
jgi:hypothetical protein